MHTCTCTSVCGESTDKPHSYYPNKGHIPVPKENQSVSSCSASKKTSLLETLSRIHKENKQLF